MTKVKFDATLTRDGDTVTHGCQRFDLKDVVSLTADKVEVEATRVTLTGAELESEADGEMFTLPNGYQLHRTDLEGYVRNVREVKAPAPAWQDGDITVAWSDGHVRVRTRIDGQWKRTEQGALDTSFETWSDHEMERHLGPSYGTVYTVVRRGGVSLGMDGEPKTGPLQVGDRVRLHRPGSRYHNQVGTVVEREASEDRESIVQVRMDDGYRTGFFLHRLTRA